MVEFQDGNVIFQDGNVVWYAKTPIEPGEYVTIPSCRLITVAAEIREFAVLSDNRIFTVGC